MSEIITYTFRVHVIWPLIEALIPFRKRLENLFGENNVSMYYKDLYLTIDISTADAASITKLLLAESATCTLTLLSKAPANAKNC